MSDESVMHGPDRCPMACEGCEGEHHWMEDSPDPDGPAHEAESKYGLDCWYSCKHCSAWATPEYVWALEEIE